MIIAFWVVFSCHLSLTSFVIQRWDKINNADLNFQTSDFFIHLLGLALLEVKSTLNDTRNFLSNWRKSDESHCTWTGITCHPGEQRVRSMYVSSAHTPFILIYYTWFEKKKEDFFHH